MDRYSRQKKFIGKDAQKKLGFSTICIVGCGALGSSSAEILVRSGVKKLILIDFDLVELSNLQRQTLYSEIDIGKLKIESLRKYLKKINSKVEIQIHNKKIDNNSLDLLDSDLIIDGLDNFETRYLVNEYAVKNDIPFIFGSTIRSEGIIFPITKNGPCLRCTFPKAIDTGRAKEQGVLASAARVTSAIQVATAIKILTGEKVESELTKFNLYNNEFYKAKVKKNELCETCSR
ncbi:adenylyltransferase [Candidatus Woesearchaeota archaeon]|nr:MAG: adenylyltransferase [Candidatus Woesearchaeota archaeon]